MSQRDGFASGFLAGAIFGSVVGGIVGTIVASRREDSDLTAEQEHQMNGSSAEARKVSVSKRRQMRASQGDDIEMETARRSLEDKIAQLNATIDEVRQQLGDVNGSFGQDINQQPSLRDELR